MSAVDRRAASARRVLVALRERVGHRIRDVDLAQRRRPARGRGRARLSTRPDHATSPLAGSAGEDLLGAGHLRHELRVDEARRLDARQAGRGQPAGTARRAPAGSSVTLSFCRPSRGPTSQTVTFTPTPYDTMRACSSATCSCATARRCACARRSRTTSRRSAFYDAPVAGEPLHALPRLRPHRRARAGYAEADGVDRVALIGAAGRPHRRRGRLRPCCASPASPRWRSRWRTTSRDAARRRACSSSSRRSPPSAGSTASTPR